MLSFPLLLFSLCLCVCARARARVLACLWSVVVGICGSSSCLLQDEELSRLLPVVQGIRQAGHRVPISVDTTRASVAAAAIAAGTYHRDMLIDTLTYVERYKTKASIG